MGTFGEVPLNEDEGCGLLCRDEEILFPAFAEVFAKVVRLDVTSCLLGGLAGVDVRPARSFFADDLSRGFGICSSSLVRFVKSITCCLAG